MTALFWIATGVLVLVVASRIRSLVHPTAFPPWMTPLLEWPGRNRDVIVARSGASAGESLLEIGPGAGWITERLLQRVGPQGRVVCLDLQPAMLHKVRERVGDAATLVCASGSRLPFRNGAFDRAFLAHVLGEIPDKRAAVAELHRVIRPAGVLAIEEGIPDPDYIRSNTLLRLGQEAGFIPAGRDGGALMYTQRFARK